MDESDAADSKTKSKQKYFPIAFQECGCDIQWIPWSSW